MRDPGRLVGKHQLGAALFRIDALFIEFGVERFEKLALLLPKAVLREKAVHQGRVKENAAQQLCQFPRNGLTLQRIAVRNAGSGKGKHLQIAELLDICIEGCAVELGKPLPQLRKSGYSRLARLSKNGKSAFSAAV